jgi:hypothetical protein
VVTVAESGWFLAGLAVGIIIGFLAGFAVSRYLAQPSYASVVFERDEKGRIAAIHYVPGAKSG